MKQVVIKTGERKRVETVNRGPLLYLSEDGWMERARAQQRPFEKGQLVNGLTYIGLSVVWAVLAIMMMPQGGPIDLVLPAMWGTLGALYIVSYYHRVNRNRNPVAVPGLYEFGLQMPTHVFIPYREMGKVERKARRGRLLKRVATIHLRSRFAKKPGSMSDGWVVPVEFLGPGGMACLKERLEISRGLKVGTPQLVIYGPDGAKTSGRGMGPVRGAW